MPRRDEGERTVRGVASQKTSGKQSNVIIVIAVCKQERMGGDKLAPTSSSSEQQSPPEIGGCAEGRGI